jgi:hypothetical protein
MRTLTDWPQRMTGRKKLTFSLVGISLSVAKIARRGGYAHLLKRYFYTNLVGTLVLKNLTMARSRDSRLCRLPSTAFPISCGVFSDADQVRNGH